MGRMAARRVRQLRLKGRPMLLARAADSLTVQGYAPPPQSGQLVDTEAQQPLIVQIGADELTAKPAFGRPRHGDKITDNGRTYTLSEAAVVCEGSTVIGWTLICMGGS